MSSILSCRVIDCPGLEPGISAIFNASGELVMTEPRLHSPQALPESFEVEAEDGVVFTVVSEAGVHHIDEDDLGIFQAMVFG